MIIASHPLLRISSSPLSLLLPYTESGFVVSSSVYGLLCSPSKTKSVDMWIRGNLLTSAASEIFPAPSPFTLKASSLSSSALSTLV